MRLLGAVREYPDPADTAPAIEPLLTAEQVGQVLGVRAKRVYELGIPHVKLSARSYRWRRSDVEAWIASRATGNAA